MFHNVLLAFSYSVGWENIALIKKSTNSWKITKCAFRLWPLYIYSIKAYKCIYNVLTVNIGQIQLMIKVLNLEIKSTLRLNAFELTLQW